VTEFFFIRSMIALMSFKSTPAFVRANAYLVPETSIAKISKKQFRTSTLLDPPTN